MQALNPAWTHRYYDDAACRELVRNQMPSLLPIYEGYPMNIQRVDLFRVVVVYSLGGFYLDLDVACHTPLDALCESSCVLGIERRLSPAEALAHGNRDAVRIANYMFGSRPGHPFWLDVIAELRRRARRPIRTEDDVLESKGPGLLTSIYHRVARQYPDLELVCNEAKVCPRCELASCQFGDFASHLHWGSWRWQH